MPTGRTGIYKWRLATLFNKITVSINIIRPRPPEAGGDLILHENLNAVIAELTSQDTDGLFREPSGQINHSFSVMGGDITIPQDIVDTDLVEFNEDRYNITYVTVNSTRTTKLLTILAEKAR